MRHPLLLTTLWLAMAAGAQAAEVSWADSFQASAAKLPRSAGLLLIDSDVAQTVSALHLSGTEVAPLRLPIGRHLQLLTLRKGRYNWESIELPYFDLPYKLALDDDRWSFRIESGVLNYMGTLIVGENRGTSTVDVRLVNRSAEILKLLRLHHPDLLQSLSLHYAGLFPDDFLEEAQEAGERPE